MSSDDRLGDAIKELARGMTEHGKDRVRFTVPIGSLEALYELRIVRTRARPKCQRVGGVLVVYPGKR
jgi:hypothetical protein